MNKIIPFSYHKNQEYFVSIIIEFVVQMSTRHISFHIGMISVLSIYDKKLMKFLSNIQKTINIVEYQIHQYDTNNSYALTTSVTTYFDGQN